jgi:alkanesulfonate monooxygenase SsuD/methylene tetrahydromethanopterin reductase-like flavin-dependent oxidoreductase (luciferase family)
VQVAKIMSSLADLSGERLKFGIGSSPWEEHFLVFGLPFAGRGQRLEEVIEIFRGLMTGDYFGYSGKFYQFPEIKINPVPRSASPLLIGGHAPVAMRRAARCGDGWISAPVSHETLKPLVAQMQQYLREERSASASYEIHGFDSVIIDVGSAQRAGDIGVTGMQVIPWMRVGSNPSLQQKIYCIKRFGDEVIAKYH